MSNDLINAVADIQEDYAIKLARELLDQGADPLAVLDYCNEGMKIVGERFEKNEYFMPELMMSGEILSQISEMATPLMEKEGRSQKKGKIVFGTVEGDIHDIAKDIVAFMLEVNGYQVYDLGIDVPPAVFIAKLQEVDANILGMSGFLHLASESMKRTVDALAEAGMRESVKVMIGGGQINEYLMNYTGADAWGNDAMAAVKIADEWTKQGE